MSFLDKILLPTEVKRAQEERKQVADKLLRTIEEKQKGNDPITEFLEGLKDEKRTNH